MMPDQSDPRSLFAELRLKDAKIELFHCLCCKDKSKLTEIEVEVGFWLVQDKAIQDRVEHARIQGFKAGLRSSTKPCHCDKAWGENEPCPRHGWSDASIKKKKEDPPGPPDLSDIEKKLKPFFQA